MTALRNLGMTEDKFNVSSTRLSTGLRINSAGDDPSGLVISEGMRAQLNGLSQAVKNAQDAVNMAKTAEGALDEVQTLLRNLRGLAVQSANSGVVDAGQLSANQASVRSIVDSINRISQNTSWGSKKLLNGSAGASVGVTNTDLVKSLYLGNSIGGKIVKSGDVSLTMTTAATQTTTGGLSTSFADGNALVTAGVVVINGTTIKAEAGDSVSAFVAKINQQSSSTGVTAALTGSGPVQVKLTSVKYGANFPINYNESVNILNGGNSATGTLGTNGVYQITTNVEPSGTASETFTGGQGPGVDGLTLSSQAGGRLSLNPAANLMGGTTVIGSLTAGVMKFQLGANSDQTANLSVNSVAADQLGIAVSPGKSIATLDLTSAAGATEAINIVDAAISQLSLMRGEIGAFQSHFLESTMRSLEVANENLTASESSIRDVDMAREMSEYTKVQILRQSGMAVLAQANQSSQNVLKLLQG